MSLSTRWRRWWARLTGQPMLVAPVARSGARAPHPSGTDQATPSPSGGLSLAPDQDAPDKVARAGRKHVGAGGFDPYSSDAGYEKPHGWESVDRK